ncbi:MAG: hypothetical protein JSU61_03675 [Fidelibacterota bacterium]|nr:MAG: hypothetical protein JSU61_03675 [Candidatus Neomarinimicrobiota bacterium]
MRKLICIIFINAGLGLAQTTMNPDLSVVGDLIIDDGELTTSGVELAIQGYVNPFARADVFLHKHAGEGAVELEEAYLSIERGLPLGLGLRSGCFRPDLGKINKEHMHTYAFIQAPGAVTAVLGDEMWSGTGLEVDVLLPLPWYSKLSAGGFANGIAHHHHEDGNEGELGEDHEHESEKSQPAYNARWSHFVDLTPVAHLEMGVSHFIGTADEGVRRLTGVDFKFRWRPDRYRSLTWQGEYFLVEADEPEPAHAVYTFANLQFSQVWNWGVVLDYHSDIEEETHYSAGVFLGYSPVEESSVFRLAVTGVDQGGEREVMVIGQIIWSLGPHKPHRF